MLLHLYAVYTWPTSVKPDGEAVATDHRPNGHARAAATDRLARDAEEFELEALMSDDDDPDPDPPHLKARHGG